jgi:hypothetical protein
MFTSSEDVAKRFASAHDGPKRAEWPAAVTSAKVTMQRPFVIDAAGAPARDFQIDAHVIEKGDSKNGAAVRAAIDDPQYDGVVVRNTAYEGDIFIPKKTDQIDVIDRKRFAKGDYEAAAPAPDAPGAIRKMDPREILADPARFQFKRDTGGASGTGDELKAVEKYDPELGGVLSVWKDPANGKTYVVNGHHRLELATRAGAPDVTVRYLDAADAPAARTKGALINIAEGRGTAIDAAKVFRDSGISPDDLAQKGISLKGAIARDGANLSKLAPSIFARVIQGELPVERAALIGELLPEHADQTSALQLLDRAEAKDKALSNDAFRELVSFVEGAPKKAGAADENMNLFGDVAPADESTAIEMATLSDYIRKRLAGEKTLFSTVSKAAKSKALEAAGNNLIGERNAQIADAANQHLAVYDKLKASAGPINNALRAAAESLGRKGAPANEIKAHAYERVRAAIRATLGEGPV